MHALKDPDFSAKLKRMLAAKRPVMITDGLAKRLNGINLKDENLMLLEVNGNPRGLLDLTQKELEPIRSKLLAPFGIRFDAPNKVALYLIGDSYLIVENFNNEPVDVSLELSGPVKARKALVLPVDGDVVFSCDRGRLSFTEMTPRTLVAVEH